MDDCLNPLFYFVSVYSFTHMLYIGPLIGSRCSRPLIGAKDIKENTAVTTVTNIY